METRKVGIMLSELSSGSLPVLFRAAGLDFFILDCEHGGFDYGAVSRIVLSARLCGITCIVRLADNGRKDIQKFMDMGADGLLLPMTNDASEIMQVVKYAKYRPVGERGISTMRAHTLYAPPPIAEYVREANAHTRVYAQIEPRAGRTISPGSCPFRAWTGALWARTTCRTISAASGRHTRAPFWTSLPGWGKRRRKRKSLRASSLRTQHICRRLRTRVSPSFAEGAN